MKYVFSCFYPELTGSMAPTSRSGENENGEWGTTASISPIGPTYVKREMKRKLPLNAVSLLQRII